MIQFTKDDKKLLQILNEEVDQYMLASSSNKYANSYVLLKGAALMSIYACLSLMIFFSESLLQLYSCYILLGPLTVFIALNIAHEAAHNILFKNKVLNQIMVLVFDILGANSQIWKYKHVDSHHMHTNLYEIDLELKQPNIVRIFPYSLKKSIHRYQHIYMPILYCFYTIIWFLWRDFKDYFLLRKKLAPGREWKSIIQLILGKSIFVLRLIILPILVLPFAWQHVLLAFIICNIVSSITVTFALVSTHVGEHSEFPQVQKNGQVSHSWIKHQFLTTTDFATNSQIVTALYGGFNHHLTHHIFPFISHAHYPAITKIILRVKKEFNIQDHSQVSIFAAIRSHLRLLKMRALEGKEPLEWMEM